MPMAEVDGAVFIALAIEPGELVDRVTILELRIARALSEDQRRSAGAALARARAAWTAAALDAAPLEELIGQLRSVNQGLWQAEDEIRRHERHGDFGAGFIAAARAIMRLNDQRARLKGHINQRCGRAESSDQKIYAD